MNGIGFLFSGIVFGLTAGITPGPLFALLISETLKNNKSSGIKVAISPLLTDIPIIITTLFILSKLEHLLNFISILGGIFLFYLGYETIRINEINLKIQNTKDNSLKKGFITNALNPHPYIFWSVVGAPLLFKAISINIYYGLLFIFGFYFFLIGSKILLVFMIDHYRNFLKNKTYIYLIKISGLMLLVYSFIFLKEGCEYLFG